MPNYTLNEIEKQMMELQSDLGILKGQLSSDLSPIGDWKIAKCQEYILAGLEPPYNIQDLHEKRQIVRNRINEVLQELERLESQPVQMEQED